jgi:hypothetical protein
VERFLKQQNQYGRRPLLIVDEAQDMGDAALEELRLLTNIHVGNHQLLQVFLVGQEQLRDTVNTPSMEQLHQRLIAATLLELLDTDDTKTYIKHRLRRVNWKGDPLISTEAYTIIQRYNRGIPRQINQICSRLLLHASIEEKHRLGEIPAVHEQPRRLSTWGLIAVPGLLAGLLLTLVYSKNTQVSRLTDQNLTTQRQSGGQKASSIATGEFLHQISKANEDMRTGTVVRNLSPASQGPNSDVSEGETRLHEPAQAYDQGAMQSKALGMEEELQQSGLPTERLPNHHLKVNLSRDGLFDFDSARIKQDALPFHDSEQKRLRITSSARASPTQVFNPKDAEIRIPDWNSHPATAPT